MSLINFLFSFFYSKRPMDTVRMEHVARKKSVHFFYDFDQWYERLKSESFPSTVLPITPETALAMVHFYQQYFFKRPVLTEKDRTLIQQLEQDIQEVIQTKYDLMGVFPRMSDRSPKDGVPLAATENNILEQYQKIIENSSDSNEQMLAISSMQLQLLHCDSAKEVLNLLLTSERVYSDLLLALECHDHLANDQWATSVILREWQPSLHEHNEFRLFVHEGKLTAISQYNHLCTFPALNNLDETQLETLSNQLEAFFHTVHPKIKASNYILDIVFIEGDIKIVELNPFAETTGSCLFSWKNDADILYGRTTQSHPSIRILKQPSPELAHTIEIILADQEAQPQNPEPYTALLRTQTSENAGMDFTRK